jgi:hypothetical protein
MLALGWTLVDSALASDAVWSLYHRCIVCVFAQVAQPLAFCFGALDAFVNVDGKSYGCVSESESCESLIRKAENAPFNEESATTFMQIVKGFQPSVDVQAAACKATVTAALKAGSGAVRLLCAAGVAPAIVRAMESFPSHLLVQKNGCLALMWLAHYELEAVTSQERVIPALRCAKLILQAAGLQDTASPALQVIANRQVRLCYQCHGICTSALSYRFLLDLFTLLCNSGSWVTLLYALPAHNHCLAPTSLPVLCCRTCQSPLPSSVRRRFMSMDYLRLMQTFMNSLHS